ncbi:MAG: outer membrane beta-barrel protein [Ferruginibacter sp.]
MKRIFLMAAMMTAVSIQSFAQPSFGLQVGGNLASTRLETESGSGNSTTKVNTDPRFGFLAGIVTEIPFGPVSFRPEVNYVQKGFKYNDEGSFFGATTTTDNKALLSYIEIPLNVTFNVPAVGSHLFFGLGPTVAWGIGGKYEARSTLGGLSGENQADIKFDGDDDANDDDIHLKSFEFSGNILAGYKMDNGFTINVGYTLGFSDILPGNDNSSWKNSGLTLKVGYMFGGPKAGGGTTTTSGSSGGTF